METYKISTNVEFDVIYADGTRRRVQEGVLYEAEKSGDMIFHNGTSRPEVLIAAAETMLVSLFAMGPGLEVLAAGMILEEDSCAALKTLAKCANKLLKIDSAEKQACFRLGQMDMKESVVACLLDESKVCDGVISSTLRAAADYFKKMEVI